MSNRPGFMVYHDDVVPVLKCVSVEEAGRLFIAMTDYTYYGTIPEFEDSPVLNMAWSFISQKLDRDDANYHEKILRSKYGAYKRECIKHGEEPLSFDAWKGTYVDLSTLNDTYPTGICNIQPESTTKQLQQESTIKQQEMESTSASQPSTPTEEEFSAFCNSLSIPADKAAHYRTVIKGQNWKATIKRFWDQDKSTYRPPKSNVQAGFEIGDAELAAMRSLRERHGR